MSFHVFYQLKLTGHECEELQKLLNEKEKLLIQELSSSEKYKNDLTETGTSESYWMSISLWHLLWNCKLNKLNCQTENKCKELNSQVVVLENSYHKIQSDLVSILSFFIPWMFLIFKYKVTSFHYCLGESSAWKRWSCGGEIQVIVNFEW